MASDYETFFDNESFAIVGLSAKRNFPVLTYRGLKSLAKTVFPVDPSVEEIVTPGFTHHSLHKLAMQLARRY